jgi:hypothetical protein
MTKNELLSLVSEKQIFKHYLNINIENIEDGKLFINPLRADEYPTCSFYRADNDNRLRWTDFAGFTSTTKNNKVYRSWDCFDTVQYIINKNGGMDIPYKNKIYNIACDINTKKCIQFENKKISIRKLSFAYIIKVIANDFNLLDGYIDSNLTLKTEVRKDKELTSYNVVHRNYITEDTKYWKKYNIDINSKKHRFMLNYFNIYPVLEITNKKTNARTYTYNQYDLCYVYYFGRHKDTTILQFYFPNRKKNKPRFITNIKGNNIILGETQLNPAPIGIITKSYKDVFLLRNYTYKNIPIQAIAPPSEGVLISKNAFNRVKYYCDYWFTLFDYDYTGIRLAIIYYKEYKIDPIFFYKYKKLNVTDIKKLYKEFGIPLVKEVLQYEHDNKNILSMFNKKDFSDNIVENNKEIIEAICQLET